MGRLSGAQKVLPDVPPPPAPRPADDQAREVHPAPGLLPSSPRFFSGPAAFRAWLEKNHARATELFVGYYKVGTGKPSMTWSESVDQALCFGWIDGVRRSVDRESYCIRFTPRKPTSTWSAINIRKVKELTKQGLMRPAGIAAFEKRKTQKSGIYTLREPAERLSRPVGEAISREQRGVGVLLPTGTVVSPHGRLLGGLGQEGRDTDCPAWQRRSTPVPAGNAWSETPVS